MKYLFLTLLTTIYAFSPNFKPRLPATQIYHSFLEEIPEEPKIVYRYRGIPPKLCASEAEEQLLERMLRNYSVTESQINWLVYPDGDSDKNIDNQLNYSINNFTLLGDK